MAITIVYVSVLYGHGDSSLRVGCSHVPCLLEGYMGLLLIGQVVAVRVNRFALISALSPALMSSFEALVLSIPLPRKARATVYPNARRNKCHLPISMPAHD